VAATQLIVVAYATALGGENHVSHSEHSQHLRKIVSGGIEIFPCPLSDVKCDPREVLRIPDERIADVPVEPVARLFRQASIHKGCDALVERIGERLRDCKQDDLGHLSAALAGGGVFRDRRRYRCQLSNVHVLDQRVSSVEEIKQRNIQLTPIAVRDGDELSHRRVTLLHLGDENSARNTHRDGHHQSNYQFSHWTILRIVRAGHMIPQKNINVKPPHLFGIFGCEEGGRP